MAEETVNNEVEATVPAQEVVLAKNTGNGDGERALAKQKPPLFMSGGQLGGLTSTKELPNALNYLVNPGDTTLAMTMRTIVPEKRTEASRMVDILAFHQSRLAYFHCQRGMDALLFKFGLNVSINGRGRTELTLAITGQREHEENKGGLGNMFKKLAWGDGKKDG